VNADQGDIGHLVRNETREPWRRCAVVMVSVRTEDRGFEYRQGVRFLDLIQCNDILCNLVRIFSVYLSEKMSINIIKELNKSRPLLCG
jgi:hypothetical protein